MEIWSLWKWVVFYVKFMGIFGVRGMYGVMLEGKVDFMLEK